MGTTYDLHEGEADWAMYVAITSGPAVHTEYHHTLHLNLDANGVITGTGATGTSGVTQTINGTYDGKTVILIAERNPPDPPYNYTVTGSRVSSGNVTGDVKDSDGNVGTIVMLRVS